MDILYLQLIQASTVSWNNMNKLRVPNQLKTTKTTERAAGTGTADCDYNAFDPSEFAGSTINTNNYFDINISRDGKTFIFTGARETIRFDLTEPYDFKTASLPVRALYGRRSSIFII